MKLNGANRCLFSEFRGALDRGKGGKPRQSRVHHVRARDRSVFPLGQCAIYGAPIVLRRMLNRSLRCSRPTLSGARGSEGTV